MPGSLHGILLPLTSTIWCRSAKHTNPAPHAWEKARRKEFGNSLTAEHHLIATWKSTNRSKNKRDPADWLPPNRAYWCTYLTDWIAIKREWGLTMDQVEADAIRKGLYVCGAYGKSDHIAGRHK